MGQNWYIRPKIKKKKNSDNHVTSMVVDFLQAWYAEVAATIRISGVVPMW
jgi:hypothetical protein